MGQPQPGRARAAPAAQSCRLGASFPDATTAPTGPAASRSPGGRGRRQPHSRAVWPRRYHPSRRRQHGRRSQAVVSWGPDGTVNATGLVHGRRATTNSMGTTVRLAPPAPSRAAAGSGSCRCGVGVRKRRAQTTRPCGWRHPRPPGLRLAHGAPASCSVAVFSLHLKLHAPSPVASPDAQVREGPGAAVRSKESSFVHPCAALGPDAASCSHAVVLGARMCSAGRARSHTHTCTRGSHGACGPTRTSRFEHKARMRDCQERRGG
jgi:hypothetical protein